MIRDSPEKPAGLCIIVCKNGRDKNDCLCKDDRHYTRTVDLQGKELTGSTKLTVAYNLLGIVYRNFPNALN